MRGTLTGIVALLGVSVPAHAQERIVLENGATIILCPMPGLAWVGIESIYRGGFADEPIAQAAHLLEHAFCRGGTATFAPGASMDELSRLGLANAETLPTFTHYDAIVPSADLALVLRIERERMMSLVIDEALIAQEAPRCADEARFIADSPMAPLGKFALMAACDVWRNGPRDIRILLDAGSIAPETVRDLHARIHRPANLTLVIAGGFDPAETKPLIAEMLGTIEGDRAPDATEPMALADQPERLDVRWDLPRTGIFLFWAPPADRGECEALSLVGTSLLEVLSSDAQIREVASFAFCSNMHWPVGELPFFIYATLRTDVEDAERKFRTRVEELVDSAIAADLRGLLAARGTMLNPRIPQAVEARTVGPTVARRMGLAPEMGEGLVAGQVALNIGMGAICLGPLDEGMDGAGIGAIAHRTLTAESMNVLMFRP